MKKIILALLGGLIIGAILSSFITVKILNKVLNSKGMIVWSEGVEFLQHKKYDKAIAMFNQAIALHPEWHDPYVGLAEAYEAKGNFRLALEEYETALGLAKDQNQKPIAEYIKRKIEKLSSKVQPHTESKQSG